MPYLVYPKFTYLGLIFLLVQIQAVFLDPPSEDRVGCTHLGAYTAVKGVVGVGDIPVAPTTSARETGMTAVKVGGWEGRGGGGVRGTYHASCHVSSVITLSMVSLSFSLDLRYRDKLTRHQIHYPTRSAPSHGRDLPSLESTSSSPAPHHADNTAKAESAFPSPIYSLCFAAT